MMSPNSKTSRHCSPALAAVLLIAVWTPAATASRRLPQDIARILEKHCLRCHNDADRKGDLSLQRDPGPEASLIHRDRPVDSLLLQAVTPQNGQRPRMPKGGQPLSADELDQLREWIAEGATWPDELKWTKEDSAKLDWWSLEPLVVPALPATPPDGSDWRTPVDRFVQARQLKHGLVSVGQADALTLLRRVHYDLVGLPPAPDLAVRFARDGRPDAYERLVDQLLASPHFGERWARHWLDVVKYADTCGYDKDKLRPNAWPYRDYVIRSLNQDKPYRRFVQEQIAGDILFPHSADGVLGLGFIAAGPWDFIGHVEVPESKIDGQVARNIDRDEMLTNTLNTFASVTIQCARCHDHKFDPISQRDYYRLQAVFAAVDRADRPYDVDPQAQRQRLQWQQQVAAIQRRIKATTARIETVGGEQFAKLDAKIKRLSPSAELKTKQAGFGYHSQIVGQQNTAKWVEIDLGRATRVERVILRPCHDDFGGIGAGFGFPVRLRVQATPAAGLSDPTDEWQTLVETDSDLPNPLLAPFIIDANGAEVRRLRIVATRLRPRKNDFIFALAEVQVINARGENVAAGTSVRALDSIESGTRWSRKNLTDGLWPQPVDEDGARRLAAVQQKRVEFARSDVIRPLIQQREKDQAESQRLKVRIDRLSKGQMVYAAATQFEERNNFKPTSGKPRPIRVLHRGDILQPGELVQAATLPWFPSQREQRTITPPETDGERRTLLAEWLASEENPLTWRSIANRVWLYHFGKAIVDTPNDFGRMGAQPSHPALLDWLASELRDRGGSLKQLHQEIVTSSTYRQAATHHQQNALVDEDNRFLWRMNRRRLEAEEIRDSILAVSGRLDTHMGGAGYYLFKIEHPQHSPHFEYHLHDASDPASHRRSIYRFVVRSQPNPYMTSLDCADSSQSTPQRHETITALQAMTMLNNRFTLTMAEHFAGRLRAASASDEERARMGLRLVTGRAPQDKKVSELTHYAKRHGWENACRLMFNLSEFVYVE